MLQSVLEKYGFDNTANVSVFGSGHINNTWKVSTTDDEYILQRVNDLVFKNPKDIAANIELIGDYLSQFHPAYKFVAPLKSLVGEEMIHLEGEGYFRMFPFVKGSHTIDIVETPEQAYEAAAQFGTFTSRLKNFDENKLKITIPGFHDLTARYKEFLLAVEKGNEQRIAESEELINIVISFKDIITVYEQIKTDASFKLRVMHHDTKISNVLLDSNNKGICVIDLDTVMPGYFISDVGDMMRTYLSPVSEEEKDFDKIEIREEFYKAIVQGYYSAMKDELTKTETGYFFYAGEFMIYMQAIRFLTDYLNNDLYYGAKYEGHNFIRAANQITLLKKLRGKKNLLSALQFF
ncbi:MAG: aminoglycoside phosphotransferase family protein [Chitinophagaceae bacterium]